MRITSEFMKAKTLPYILTSEQLLLSFSLIGFASFAIPFSLGYPQLLVGTIVNACLFLAAAFLPTSFIYPIIFFPSLAVLSRGLIFGPLTSFLVLMIPFFWLGNWLLVFGFRKIFTLVKNYGLSFFVASLIKSVFLITTSFLLIKLKLLPRQFLNSMGSIQFITALLGGLLSLGIKNLYARNSGT